MRKTSLFFPAAIAFLVAGAGALAAESQQVLVEPVRDSGQSVTAAFEGWFANTDGSFSLLFGYLNRNRNEVLDIPVGPNNRMEPGGPDQGQPTHFLPRRQWGVFTVTVPKDFGSKKLTWTITANGVTTSVPGTLDALWEVSPFVNAQNNTPPFVGFAENGPFVQGPRGTSTSLKAVVGTPLPITIFAADDAVAAGSPPRSPAAVLLLTKLRGPGEVKISNSRPAVEPASFTAPPKTTFQGKASTVATFSEPGEYVLRVQANDWTGEGGKGFQCCWTNAQVRVSVSTAK